MDNLIFCLNVTIPIFLTLLLGAFFRKVGLFTPDFVKQVNRFVFQGALPVLLFQDLGTSDFAGLWDGKFVLFCFLATFFSIVISIVISFFLKDGSLKGEFVQASYRSSAALFGIAFVENVYGDSGMAPLMILGTVPLYNIMAVIVLSFLKPGIKSIDRPLLKKTIWGILTNPIILGIVAGSLWSLSGLTMPLIMEKTVHNVAVLATPLGLMAMGASFDGKKAVASLKPALLASFNKLVLFAVIFLPLAVLLKFHGSELLSILVMLGSPTTISCYIMAKNMDHDGALTSNTVLITTLASAFTMTGWLYVLKVVGLI